MTRTVTGTMCAYWIREFEFENESNSDFHFTTSTSRDSHIDSVSDSPIPIPTRRAFPSLLSFPCQCSILDSKNANWFWYASRDTISKWAERRHPSPGGRRYSQGHRKCTDLELLEKKAKQTIDETKQNERIINMENVDSCRRRRKWWSNFRSTTQCATQIWQSDRLPTPPLLPPPPPGLRQVLQVPVWKFVDVHGNCHLWRRRGRQVTQRSEGKKQSKETVRKVERCKGEAEAIKLTRICKLWKTFSWNTLTWGV